MGDKDERRCPVCGAAMPGDAPAGPCAACLSSGGLPTARFPSTPAGQQGTIKLSFPSEEQVGETIGHYKLLERIGTGGFGAVYVAEQKEPVRRRVALKLIKLGMDTKEVVARFEAERQALAMMDHPNIAKVFDAGVTETGRPYFVMELVRGIKITDYCDQKRLPTQERLILFNQVCRAVQHAHQKGIIHRDIKPSNILVTLYDGVPVPKVIDFGIAKATQGNLTDKTVYTQFQHFMGTPAYMSPEQAEMSGLDTDTRTDIYSLGVLLYELLTGRTPFDQKELLEAGFDEMRRIIRESEPPRPSTRLNTLRADEQTAVAKQHGTEPPKLIHLVRGDLDWIVMKTLEKDRTRRYDTANGLAMDIERHMNSEPVVARPPSAAYRFQKMVRRNKLVFFSGAAVVASLVIGLGVSLRLFVKEKEDRRQAVAAKQQAQAALASEARLRHEADAARQQAEADARRAEVAATEVKMTLAASDIAEATRLIEANDNVDAVAFLERCLSSTPENRAALTRLSMLLTYRPWMVPTLGLKHQNEVTFAQFSPDGRRIVTASQDSTARIWDAQTGRLVTGPLNHPNFVSFAQFSPDGTKVATVTWDNHSQVWDAQTGRLVAQTLQPGGGIASELLQALIIGNVTTTYVWPGPPLGSAQYFSSDGKLLLASSATNAVRVWNAQTGKPLSQPMKHGGYIAFASFSPDAKRVVTASWDQTARVWDAQTGKPLTDPLKHDSIVNTASFSPDGKRVVTSSWAMARLWDAQTGQPLTAPLMHKSGVLFAQFSPDGKRVVTASWDYTARVWDAQTGQPLTDPLKHGGPVNSAVFSADAKRVVTASADGTARVWDAQTGRLLAEPLKHKGAVQWASFSPDGRRIVTTSKDNLARVWDTQTDQPLTESFKHQGSVNSAQFSPDSKRVATASADNLARVWDAQTGQPLAQPLAHGGPVNSVQFSPDGERVVTASQDSTARVWDARTGQPLTDPLKHTGVVETAQFSADGTRVVTASRDGNVRVWDAQSGQPLTDPLKNGGNWAGCSAQFSPDGKLILSTSADSTARVWNAQTGKLTLDLPNYGNSWACFSPDGKRVVSGSLDSRALIWEVQTGKLLAAPLKHGDEVTSAQFSPNGKRVVTASRDMTARVWDAQIGQPLTEPLKHDDQVMSAAFSPDGEHIVTASLDGTARIWDAQTGQPLTEPLKHWAAVNFAQFSPDGRRILTASSDGLARVWDVGLAPSKCPEWLLRLAEAISGCRLNKQGILESTSIDRSETLAQIRRLLKTLPDDGDGVAWGRWLLDDPATRTISPFCKITAPQYIEERITERTTPSLDEAERLAAGNDTLMQRISAARSALAWAEQAGILRSNGNAHARACEWTNAIADFSKLVELDPADHLTYHSLAPLLVQSGDLAGYRHHCALVLALFGATNDPVVAERMAKDCLILPAGGIDLDAVARMAETAVTKGEGHRYIVYFQFAKGLAEFRQGHFASAADWMRKVLASPDRYYRDAQAELVLAMAQYQLGQREDSSAALAKGAGIVKANMPVLEGGDIGANWTDWIIAHALLNEAKALIERPQAPGQ